jgi:C4-dicarboxylate transporter DctM subunit
MYPALIQNGYPDKIALGVLTVAGSLGILIPPSIPMIIFSIVTGTDVNELFMAGVVPGILCGILLVILSIYYGYKYNLATKSFSLKNLLSSLKKGLPALFMPILVLGGIYSGSYTVTEAAAVAAVYAIIIEMFVYRDIKIKGLIDTLYDSVVVLGIIFIIISMATVFNYFLTLQEAPVMLLDWMSASITTQSMFIICTIVLLLIVGLFMDIISAILILAPLLVPAAINYEVNLVHLGIIFVLGMEIGYMTPPVGINLFVASSVFDKPFGKVVVAAFPYTLCLLIALIMVAFIPDIALFLNDMLKEQEAALP